MHGRRYHRSMGTGFIALLIFLATAFQLLAR